MPSRGQLEQRLLEDQQRLEHDRQLLNQESCPKRYAKKTGFVVGMVCLVIFVLLCILQLIMYQVALFGCGPSRLNGYYYPGGGTSDYGGPEFNLIPKESMLVEREHAWWGDGFDVFPANRGSSTLQGAQTGFFFRTWGPLFNTYGYEDTESSKITMYMRQRFPQSYFYMSHVIYRCDGKGPSIVVSEGSNFISNRIRRMFGMNQGYSFKVWMDSEEVAIAQETGASGHGIPSVAFRNISSGETCGSSTLSSRDFHGSFDEWFVQNSAKSSLPYYANGALTMNYAFSIKNRKDRKAAGEPSKEDHHDEDKGPHSSEGLAVGSGNITGLVQVPQPEETASHSEEKPASQTATSEEKPQAPQKTVSGESEEPPQVLQQAETGKSEETPEAQVESSKREEKPQAQVESGKSEEKPQVQAESGKDEEKPAAASSGDGVTPQVTGESKQQEAERPATTLV